MSSTVVKSPGQFSFIGNPIVYEILSTDNRSVTIDVTVSGETYSQSYYPFADNAGNFRCKIDISGILFQKNIPSKFPEGVAIVSPMAGHGISYTSTIYLIDNSNVAYSLIFEGLAFPGGINDQVSAYLADNGKNIFTARLRSLTQNFLFTTRTHGRTIRLKKSEMYPFLFLYPGELYVEPTPSLKFRSALGNELEAGVQAVGSLCLMDLYKIWDTFVSDFSEFTDKIEVLVSGVLAFAFLLDDPSSGEEKYKIRFRNSLGAFEVLEVTGVASHEPEFGDETIWKELTGSNFYENRRDRVSITDVVKVETGYKSKDDLLFIRDLVCSDEAYFYYPDGTYFRCTVKADKMAYRQKKVAPTSVSLVVTEVGAGKYVSPELDRLSLDENGIYNETFDQTFDQTF